MDVTFIDSEPPDPAGGGIRTYLRLALRLCRERGATARVYTHNPNAYPGEEALPIGRTPWPARPWRSVAYKLLYGETVLWEQARWLERELASRDRPGHVYEFCDFLGYGYYACRNPALRPKTIVRVHTPNFLVAPSSGDLRARVSAWLGRARERDALARAAWITVPSAEFMREKLPDVRNPLHLPNPLPSEKPGTETSADALAAPGCEENTSQKILYLGRVEPRKGVTTLVKAFIRLASENAQARLTLVGGAPGANEVPEGNYAGEVRRLIDTQPSAIKSRIAWEPPCGPAERDAHLHRHGILAVPSLWENSPYVYFEGMAAGSLCVGSRTGEMKAAAEVTGGLLAAPGDEDDWLRALRLACGGEGRLKSIAAQFTYLKERRGAIPDQQWEFYRKVSQTR